ncbi:hypothetical protein ElyMa_006408900 [Elysia marginata]|uniref:Uncharacterized protein n=1 Tax=Elysia marginata TaxID=1093978 RepID=A0AAV4HSM5_9GAST|nr:hypothetical protein ElyMa_006408900 [Elysia marginata]
MQRVWHRDQRKEDQDDAHWKGYKSAYNNSGKRCAWASLKIFITWTHGHGGCCHSERGYKYGQKRQGESFGRTKSYYEGTLVSTQRKESWHVTYSKFSTKVAKHGPIPRRFKRRYRRSKCGATGDFLGSHGQKRHNRNGKTVATPYEAETWELDTS